MNERKNNIKKKDEKDYYFPVTLSQLFCSVAVVMIFFFVRSTDSGQKLSEYYGVLLSEDFLSVELDSAVSGVKEYLLKGSSSFAVFGSRVEPYEEEATTTEAITEALPQTVTEEEQTLRDEAETPETPVKEASALYAADKNTVPLKLSYKKKEQKMLFPLYEGRYTSYFGERTDPITEGSDYHKGIDIGADEGDRIRAVYDGRVISVGSDGRSGKYVFLEHEKDVVTFYCHCSEILVKKGDRVSQGDTIALVGSTGYSTGPHLHFEVRIKDVSVDPLPLLENAADS